MADIQTTELLPCPFCGGEAEIERYTIKPYVACMKCGCSMPDRHQTAEQAIEAWNTRATHGTLTAEQVRKAVNSHGNIMDNRLYENWQAVADELNAALGSVPCEPKWTLQGETQTQEFWSCECGNCGECFGVETRESFPFKMTIDKVDIPNFCPNCGKAVKR